MVVVCERRTSELPAVVPKNYLIPFTCGEAVVVPKLLDSHAVEVLANDVQVEGLQTGYAMVPAPGNSALRQR